MPILKEIWVDSLVGNLFSDDSILSKAVDHSEFSDGHSVHVPNAGAPAEIIINPSTFPVEVGKREDTDLKYDLDTYAIKPIRVGRTEEIELSYNKRESVAGDARSALREEVAIDTVKKWCDTAKKKVTKKPSESIKDWIKAAAIQFKKDKVPFVNRYIMLTEDGYYAFLGTLSENQATAFTASADVAKGLLGKYYGFEFVQETSLPTGVEMLAWQKRSVSVAKGEVELFEEEGSPTMYGDVISGQVRAGGSIIRNDGKGVYVVKTA